MILQGSCMSDFLFQSPPVHGGFEAQNSKTHMQTFWRTLIISMHKVNWLCGYPTMLKILCNVSSPFCDRVEALLNKRMLQAAFFSHMLPPRLPTLNP